MDLLEQEELAKRVKKVARLKTQLPDGYVLAKAKPAYGDHEPTKYYVVHDDGSLDSVAVIDDDKPKEKSVGRSREYTSISATSIDRAIARIAAADAKRQHDEAISRTAYAKQDAANGEVRAATAKMSWSDVQAIHPDAGSIIADALAIAAKSGQPVARESRDIELYGLRGSGVRWVIVWAMPDGTYEYAHWLYFANLPTSHDGSYNHE